MRRETEICFRGCVSALLITVLTLFAPRVSLAESVTGNITSAKPAQKGLKTRITYSCVDLPIDTVLMNLAEQANIDIVKSPKVTGKVTAKITDVPLEEALTNILAAYDYTYIATDSMIRVVPLPEVATMREQLINRIYQVTYADANEVASGLREFLSDRGKIALSRGTSHIIVTDTETKIKAIDKFIEQIDLITAQVLVEVRLYDITTNEGFELGTQWRAGRNTPLKTTQHEKVTSTRSGYDFDQLLPHLGDILPRESKTVTSTPEMETGTSTSGTVATETADDNRKIDTVDSVWNTGLQDWVNDDREVETRSGSTTETVRYDNLQEKSFVPEHETTQTETERLLGPGGGSFEDLYRDFENSTVTRSAKTEQYITRRRKPFVGGSFDRVEGGTLSFSLLNDAVDLELALQMLHQQVEAKLLANPRVLVLDNETADFEIVREIPFTELSQTGRDPITWTRFKEAGVNLKVTPHITKDGMLRLHIVPEFGIVVGLNADGAPTTDIRRADTTAMVKDGQTVVLGGLRQKKTVRDIAKVPILGDLPLIGGLFRSETESEKINELVLFITTTIVVEPRLSEAERIQFEHTEFAGPQPKKLKIERGRPVKAEPAEDSVPEALDVLLERLQTSPR
ncbi:MAG TPA: secretin N-terminal domain-containing protein [Sedimentisphaerales bacterium]|nr:secretin N-terminal domain-containing protein [Sedimentisphaerales bacterium]